METQKIKAIPPSSVEWHLFARGIYTIVSYEVGLICAVLGWTLASEILIAMATVCAGLSLILAGAHQYRQARLVDTV
jgi:uncharacterized membrane protein